MDDHETGDDGVAVGVDGGGVPDEDGNGRDVSLGDEETAIGVEAAFDERGPPEVGDYRGGGE